MVLFVAALSDYDTVLYEDNKTNRLVESIHLFEEICNSRFFFGTSMVLFLNKSDLFKEKIKHRNITAAFPEYDGEFSF